MDFNEVNLKTHLAKIASKKSVKGANPDKIKVGVDLGTCFIVIVVLDEFDNPIAMKMERSSALKDGLVVDYMGAVETVKRLKSQIENELGFELFETAIAIPPGTDLADCKTHKYVVNACGFEVINVVDEPTAANNLLKIDSGVVVDIGGGTTGIAVFKGGKVSNIYDEATGGTHITLTLSGAKNITFEEAEKLKTNSKNHKEIIGIVSPVIEKMGQIVLNHIGQIEDVYLVGGTCYLEGFENVFERYTNKNVLKPKNPLLITPIGIAMACKKSEV